MKAVGNIQVCENKRFICPSNYLDFHKRKKQSYIYNIYYSKSTILNYVKVVYKYTSAQSLVTLISEISKESKYQRSPKLQNPKLQVLQ